MFSAGLEFSEVWCS